MKSCWFQEGFFRKNPQDSLDAPHVDSLHAFSDSAGIDDKLGVQIGDDYIIANKPEGVAKAMKVVVSRFRVPMSLAVVLSKSVAPILRKHGPQLVFSTYELPWHMTMGLSAAPVLEIDVSGLRRRDSEHESLAGELERLGFVRTDTSQSLFEMVLKSEAETR